MKRNYILAGGVALLMALAAFGGYYVGRGANVEVEKGTPDLQAYLSRLADENVYSLRSIKVGDTLGLFKVRSAEIPTYQGNISGDFQIGLQGETYIIVSCGESDMFGSICAPSNNVYGGKIPRILERGVSMRQFAASASQGVIDIMKANKREELLVKIKDPTLVYVGTEKIDSAQILSAEPIIRNAIVLGDRTASFVNFEKLIAQNLLLQTENLDRDGIIFLERKPENESGSYGILVDFGGEKRLYEYDADGNFSSWQDVR